MAIKNVHSRAAEAYEMMKSEFGYNNKLAAPKLTKVVIAVATGSAMKKDRHKNEFVVDRLSKITGQKPSIRKAKQSVASFKIREGDEIGVAVTLRGKRMYDFLDKVFSIALPRTKDFRGLDKKNVDAIGNMTFGIKEHSIFPEINLENMKDIFSMQVTVTTTAKSKEQGTALFRHLGIPLRA